MRKWRQDRGGAWWRHWGIMNKTQNHGRSAPDWAFPLFRLVWFGFIWTCNKLLGRKNLQKLTSIHYISISISPFWHHILLLCTLCFCNCRLIMCLKLKNVHFISTQFVQLPRCWYNESEPASEILGSSGCTKIAFQIVLQSFKFKVKIKMPK